jgi:hypothetical protein
VVEEIAEYGRTSLKIRGGRFFENRLISVDSGRFTREIGGNPQSAVAIFPRRRFIKPLLQPLKVRNNYYDIQQVNKTVEIITTRSSSYVVSTFISFT